MADGIRGAETASAAAFVAYAELPDTQRANLLLGKLLQALPETPIDVHMQHVAETIEVLKPHGGVNLGEKHSRHTFGYSQAIEGRRGRSFVVLETEDRTDQTVFYRSTSHAVWRAHLGKGIMGYIAKEMFGPENSVDAPLALQKFLSKVADEPVAESPALTDILFALHNDRPGLPGWPVVRNIAEAKMYAAGIATTPRYTSGDIISDDPDKLFVAAKTPLLDTPLDEWTSNHPLYGVVTSTVYPSADRTIRYQMNSADYADHRQHWIGTAQVVGARITRLALPKEFLEIPAELLKPPIDYGENTGRDYEERRQSMSRFEQFVLEAGLA